MKKIVSSAILAVMIAVPVLGCDKEATVKNVSEANNSFAIKVYKKLQNKEGNFFISPYSITSALAMTYAGADGKTAEEMASVLSIKDVADPHAEYKKLRLDLNSEKEVKLHVANSLWPQKGYPFLKEYLTFSKDNYDVDIKALDFAKKSEKARTTINSWVSEKTVEKIPELIPEGVLNALTKMVLVNAIYFKGDWKTPFNKKATTTETFYADGGKTVKTKLMFKNAKYPYKEELGLQVLELPYSGDNLSMVVLLPNKKDGIKDLEKALTAENLTQWMSGLQTKKVNVHFPRFTLKSGFSLAKQLAKMGMSSAFNQSTADFSKMDGKKNNLFIGDVIHKTFIAVDEEGTEAAGATAVVMRAYAVRPEETPDFRADRPFIYLIKENRSNTVLFLGRFSTPTEIVSEEAR